MALSPWSPAPAQLPTFGWARSLGTISSISKTCEDPQGRMIAMGLFTGTHDLDLGPGVMQVVGGSGNSTFLTAIQANGTFDWVIALTSTNGINGYDLAVAPDGSIILTGSFRGTVDLDASPTSETSVSAGSDWDVFMTKYSPDGEFQWGFSLGNNYDELTTRIAVDGAGNIIHGHRARGSFDMDPGPATVTFEGGSTGIGVMSKYNADGVFQWFKPVGANAHSLSVLPNGNIMGVFPISGQVTIGQAPNTIALGDVAVTNAQAIIRFNAQGDPQQGVFIPWLQSIAVAYAPDGAVTMAGSVTDESDLDPGPGTNIHTPNGVYDAFALRVNADMEGDWGVTWGDDSSDDINSMDVDGYGNLYIVADLYGPFDVDPGPGTYLLDNGTSTNGYLLMLNHEDGTMGFAVRLMDSETGFLNPNGIRLTSDGTIITFGTFRATAPVDPWTGSLALTVEVFQTQEVYICTFGQEIGLGAQEAQAATTALLYPVPCTNMLTVNGHERTMPYRILDMTGRVLLAGNITPGPAALDVSSLPSGAYHLQLVDAQGASTSRFLKQ